MKILFVISILFLSSCKPSISTDLKKAWSEVNSDQDIFRVHTELYLEHEAVNQRVAQNEQMGFPSEKSDLKELAEKMNEEERRILKVQKQIEKASPDQIDYLLSKSK